MAERPETQEQSIKARKSQLYDADVPTGPALSRKPFVELLRETPPKPLSVWVKAVLWAVGVLVVGLLVLTFLSAGKGKPGVGKAAPKKAAVLIERDARDILSPRVPSLSYFADEWAGMRDRPV